MLRHVAVFRLCRGRGVPEGPQPRPPADLAYGNDTGGSKPSGTLVFVVDILGAEENPQTLQRAQAASSAAAAEASASATATPAATASATAQ